MGARLPSQIEQNEKGRSHAERPMNELGKNIVPEIQRNHVEQLKIPGKIGKKQVRKFHHSAVFQVQLRQGQVVDQRVPADRWGEAKEEKGASEDEKARKKETARPHPRDGGRR